jgi:1,4-dihydroxy-2-naphthoyl-CoA synthase
VDRAGRRRSHHRGHPARRRPRLRRARRSCGRARGVGSVDAGHGTGYLARIVGEKKAREIWYLCRQYSAQDALAMGLVNKVVPFKDLRAEVEQWCAELLQKSPTALALAKQSFNIDSEQRAGVAQFAHTALGLYYGTEEALEGRNAFVEKRPVDFGKFRA